MRQRTGSLICDGCGKLISVDEPKCPYCGRFRPGLWGFGPALKRLFGTTGDPSQWIVLISGTLYLLSVLLDVPAALGASFGLFNLLSPATKPLYLLGMTGGLAHAYGMWWTVLSATLLHGSLLHIVFNLYWLKQLGPAVQRAYGAGRFLIVFVASGAVGFVASNLLSGAPTIGASGAIFGLIGALLVHSRKTGDALITKRLTTIAILMFLIGLVSPAVNNYAHAGGFAGGWLAAVALGSGVAPRESALLQLAGIAGLVASVVAVIASALFLAQHPHILGRLHG